MQTAAEVCNRNPVTVPGNATVVEAAQAMRREHALCVVVVDEDGERRVARGLVTDRDITVGVVATMPERLQQLKVEDILYAPLVAVPAHADLVDVVTLMRQRGVRVLPVVDAEGALLGVLTFDAVMRLMSEEMRELASVAEQEFERERNERELPRKPRRDEHVLWGPLI